MKSITTLDSSSSWQEVQVFPLAMLEASRYSLQNYLNFSEHILSGLLLTAERG